MIKINVTRMAAIAVLSSLAFVGCTKSVPYKYETKERTLQKLSENDLYLYMPTTGNSTRSSDVARPFWQGQEKLVKFRYTETTLQVVEVDRESRFAANPTNEKLVLEFPIKHVAYRCAEDSFGECTNKEEENKDISWDKRSLFQPNFEAGKVIEVNTMPVELDNLFSGGFCYQNVGGRFLGYEFSPDKIELEFEKNFNANIFCSDVNSLSDLSFSQVYHYSFVKLDKVATPGFKPVKYPTTDENTFGFFTTEHVALDIDGNSTSQNKSVLMNHWNPNRKVIDYHLTANFNKSENAQVKAASFLAVDRINEGLKAAGVDLKIKLHDETDENPGDLTKSMIVLVEDPSAAGLLGYGPSTINPLTGEIISARTVMYKGILEGYMKMSYEEIRRNEIELRGKRVQKSNGITVSNKVKFQVLPSLSSVMPPERNADRVAKSIFTKKIAKLPFKQKTNGTAAQMQGLKIQNVAKNYTKNVVDKKAESKYIFDKSKHCMFDIEALSVDTITKEKIIVIMGEDLPTWEDLSTDKKEEVLKIMMPIAWVPTLVHELGHNLGLRHNFSGSEDKANYYTTEELASQGISHIIPYSSVMDYGASELNVLSRFGKYDIAALRFAYNREVEMNDGEGVKIVPVQESLGAMEAKLRSEQQNPRANLDLKDYKYCTDEHVGPNAGCKRFDAGTTNLEIAQSLIKSYKDRYYLRNFRHHRLNFSLMGELGYAGSIDYTFDNLRTFFEVRERIVDLFGLDPDDRKWAKDPNLSPADLVFLNDLNAAALLSAEFFLEVLQTPDMSCAVAQASDPSTIVQLVPLKNINAEAASCFDFQLNNPAIKIVGSIGKAFDSKRGMNPESNYLDQIETRGIWIDKLLAIRYLLARETGSFSFDRLTTNYTDVPRLRDGLINAIADFALNKTEAVVTVRDEQGSPLVSGVVAVETLDSHAIPATINPGLAKRFKVPAGKSLFVQEVLQTVANEMQSTLDQSISGQEIADLFGAHIVRAVDIVDPTLNVTNSFVIRGKKVVATEGNILANILIDNHALAVQVEKLDSERLQEIIAAREEGQLTAPTDAPADELFAWKIDLETLKNHLELGLSSAGIQTLLDVVPDYR